MKKCLCLFLLLWSFSGLLKSQTNCASSLPFCANQGAVTFPASTNTSSESGPSYGCLATQPNPAWYYFQVSNSGSIVLSIAGTGGADVDFICWGPFTSATGNCGNLTTGNTVDCSYSSSATETCTIPNGITGQYYQLLITNYANVNQNINFNQTGGTGSTNCGLLSSNVTSTTICQGGGPVTLTANSNLTGKTYTWNPGGQNTATISVNPSVTTVYTVTIHGTTSTSTQTTIVETGTVTVNPNPTVTVPSSVAVCQGNSAVVNTTVSPSGTYTYNWTTGATTSSISTSSNGVVTVTVTNSSTTCSSTASSSVIINPLPSLTMPSTQTLSCASPSVSLVASASPTTSTPAWTGGVCGGANSYTATACTPGTYTLTVTDPATGCSNSGTVSVVPDNNAPAGSASNSGPMSCITQSAQVVATTTATPVSYSWTGPGAVAGASSSTGTVTVPGTYSCVITNTATGCSSTVTTNVAAGVGLPSATLTTSPANDMLTCTHQTVTINATGSPAGGVSYSWSTGSTTSSASTSNAGVVTVTVTNTATGCTITAQYTVTSNTTPPNLTASGGTLSCASPSTSLQASSTNTNVTYSWTGPAVSSGSNTASPIVGAPGDYTVVATNTVTGCTSSSVVTVSQTGITAAFTANPANGVAPLDVNFTNQSTGATSYTWVFGDGNGSMAANPSNTYLDPGTYVVTLVATAGSCHDTAQVTIVVEPAFSIQIPNVFTPNGDNKNDVFYIKSTGVKDLSMTIFNRWGEKMYDGSGAQASWNGQTAGGAKAPDGTYFFLVKASGFDGKEVEKQGTVSLYR